MTSFDDDLQLERQIETADGEPASQVYSALISDAWQINVGPNGGYIAALLLKAIKLTAADLQSRSFTTHFLSASVAGPAAITVSIEKLGRTVSTATARLTQRGKTIAISICSFAPSRQILSHNEIKMPLVVKPGAVPAAHRMNASMPYYGDFRAQYDQRLTIGPIPPQKGVTACVGGWTRLKEPRPIDDLSILAISDSWYPALFSVTEEKVHAPTIDHTVHFLRAPSINDAHAFVLVMFETEVAADGYLIEDGFIWSESGELLARSRQLAIILEQG